MSEAIRSAHDVVVRFSAISKHYGAVRAVDAVDLDIHAQRVTAIVGESGSGKTTLLQLINGLIPADSGTLSVFGEPLPSANALPAFRRRIGYAVQGVGLFPHLNVFANATLMARLADWGSERINERFVHLCGLLDLDPDLRRRFVHELSGGQQQRVSLCRAMMLQPELLLLDEPFSAIDPITRAGIHEQFGVLRGAEQVSTVLVTHDMTEARKLADDLVIVSQGRIEQAAPMQEVLQHPASPYVAQLLDS